jgi:hypothetical protein
MCVSSPLLVPSRAVPERDVRRWAAEENAHKLRIADRMLWWYGPGAKVRTKEGVLATCGQLASGHPHHPSLLSVIRLSFIFAALLFSASPARSQISPGPLAKAHQSLNGTSQCASCHQFGTSTPTFKCLECHKEIARLLYGIPDI